MKSIGFNKFHSRHVDVYNDVNGHRQFCVECCLDFVLTNNSLFSRKAQVLDDVMSVVERRSHELIIKKLIVIFSSQSNEELTKMCFKSFERIIGENPSAVRKNNITHIFEIIKQKKNLPSMIHLIGLIVGNENLVRLVSKNYKNELVALVNDCILNSNENVQGEIVFIIFSIGRKSKKTLRRVLELITSKGVSVFEELLDQLKSSANVALQLNVLSTLAIALDYGMVSFFSNETYPEALVGVILSSDSTVQLGTLQLLRRSLQMDYLGQSIARSHIPDFLFEVLSQSQRNVSSTNPKIPILCLESLKLLLPYNVFLSPLLSHGMSIILSHLPFERDRNHTEAYVDFLTSTNHYIHSLNHPGSIGTLGEIYRKRLTEVMEWCGDIISRSEALDFVSSTCDYLSSFFSLYGSVEGRRTFLSMTKKKKKRKEYINTELENDDEKKEKNIRLVIKLLLQILMKLQRLGSEDFLVLLSFLNLLTSLPSEMLTHPQLQKLRIDVTRRIVVPYTVNHHLETQVMDHRFSSGFVKFLTSVVRRCGQQQQQQQDGVNRVEFGIYLCQKGVVSVIFDIGEQTDLESLFHESRVLISSWIDLFRDSIPPNILEIVKSTIPKLPRKNEDILRVFYEDDPSSASKQISVLCILHVFVNIVGRVRDGRDHHQQQQHPNSSVINVISMLFSRKKLLRAFDHMIHRVGARLPQSLGVQGVIWILEIITAQKKEKVSEGVVRQIASLLMSHWRSSIRLDADHQHILEWILEYPGPSVRPFAVGLLSKMWEDQKSSGPIDDQRFKSRFSKTLTSPGIYSQLLMTAKTDLQFLSTLSSLIEEMPWIGMICKSSKDQSYHEEDDDEDEDEEKEDGKKEFMTRLNSVILCLMTMNRVEGYDECMKNVLGILHCLHPSDLIFFSSHLVKLLGTSLAIAGNNNNNNNNSNNNSNNNNGNERKYSYEFCCILYTIIIKMMSYIIFFGNEDRSNSKTSIGTETTRIRNTMLQMLISDKLKKRITQIIYPDTSLPPKNREEDRNEDDILLLLLQVTLTLVRFGGQVFAPTLGLTEFYILLSSRSALIRSLTCVLFRMYLQIFPFRLSSENQRSFLVFKLQNCLVRDDDETEIIKGVVDCIEMVIQKFSFEHNSGKDDSTTGKDSKKNDDLFLWNEYLMEIGLKKGIWRGFVNWTGLRVFRMFCQYRVPKFVDRDEMSEFTKVLVSQFFNEMRAISGFRKKKSRKTMMDEDDDDDDDDENEGEDDDDDELNVFEEIEETSKIGMEYDDDKNSKRVGCEWLDKMKELLHVLMILQGFGYIKDKKLLNRIRVVVEECIHFMNFGFDVENLKTGRSVFYLRKNVVFVKDLLFREGSRDEQSMKILVNEFLGVCNQVVWNIKFS